MECAGNGRSFFTSQQGQAVSGTAWTLGAIGMARWRGVRLADVLRRAGIGRHAVDVLPRALDAQVVTDGVNLGRVRRPLPAEKALDDVVLAHEMNGEPLLTGRSWSGGAPVRAVEVSTDGGTHWRRARLRDEPRAGSWVRWAADWVPKERGPAVLLARATDRSGRTQPVANAHNTQGYLFDAVVRHPVSVV